MPNLWWPCNLGFCPSRGAWDKWMDKCKIDKDRDYPELGRKSGATFTSYKPDGYENYDHFGLITVADYSDDVDPTTITSVIVHESVHAFQYVCWRLGEKFPSDEFQAYGIQNIYHFMETWFSTMRWNKTHGKSAADDHSKADGDMGPGTAARVPIIGRFTKKRR